MPGSTVTFADPWVLYGLVLVPILVVWYLLRYARTTPDIRYSSLAPFQGIPPSLRERLRHLPFAIRLIALTLLVIALARPQSTSEVQNRITEGIDIVLALDISGSMLAEDLRPNRIEAAKAVAADFIAGRESDRIGLVVFAGESFTQCPMTLDYRVLTDLLRRLKTGMVEDGTAIGMGMAQAVNRLRSSEAKSRVIILLTDGMNNRGEIDPLTAAQIAQSFGVRVYAIGVGTQGEAPYPVQTPFGIRYQNMPVDVDEATLRKIADMTGGEYFRATSNRTLREIYQKIDALEKTRVEVRTYRSTAELFGWWAWSALLFLVLEFALRRTWLRRLPI